MKYIVKMLLVLFLFSCNQKKESIDDATLVIAKEIASNLHCISDSLVSYSSFNKIFIKTSSYDTTLKLKSFFYKKSCLWEKINIYESKNDKQSFFLRNSDYIIIFEDKKNIIYCRQERKPTRANPRYDEDKSVVLFTISKVDSIWNQKHCDCELPYFIQNSIPSK